MSSHIQSGPTTHVCIVLPLMRLITYLKRLVLIILVLSMGMMLNNCTHVFNALKKRKGPRLIHVYTKKGKGFAPAEADQIKYHAIGKIHAKAAPVSTAPKYSDVFGQWLCDQAEQDSRLLAITPAMCEGSGMVQFAKQFPERFFDVAIAEQHAVTLAAGMACEGLKPVVAIYSTFLQRGYDQLIHDVALQNLRCHLWHRPCRFGG